MASSSKLFHWLTGATLGLLAACAGTVETGSSGSSASSGGGSSASASSSSSGDGGGSASSGGGSGGSSASSSASTGSGAGASPVSAELAIDVYPDQPFGEALDVAVDPAGNIVVAAGASPALWVAPGVVGTALTKYSPSGQKLWQNLYVPSGPNNPLFDWFPAARLLSIAADAAGNVYASGEVGGQVDIGGGVIIDSGLPTFAMPNVRVEFLLKLDPSGNLLWHKEFKNSCLTGRVAASPGGGVLFTCTTLPADLGGGLLNGKLSVAAFDTDGSYLWGQGLGGLGIDVGFAVQDLAPMPSGDWVISGYFSGQADFGGGFALDGGMVSHLFVARLDGASGATVWAKEFGDDLSPAWTGSTSVAVDPQGDVIVGGLFYTSVDFGGGPLVNPEAMLGVSDGFLAKLAGGDGSHLWSLAASGMGADEVRGVALTGSGDLLITAYFTNELDLGGQAFGAPAPKSMLLAKLSSAAPVQILEVSTFGSITPSPGSIASGPGGVLAIGGSFTGTIDFGPPVGAISSMKDPDPFLLVLTP